MIFKDGGCRIGLVLTVAFPIDGAFVEGHDVLREGAGLVRKDVFDLTELFVEGRGSRFSWCVRSSVIHVSVPVDVVTVA